MAEASQRWGASHPILNSDSNLRVVRGVPTTHAFVMESAPAQAVPRSEGAMPSTVIRSFDYDPAQRRLDVTFVTGRRYSYFDVPPDIYAAMKASFAKGEFFNAQIRNRYRFEEAPRPWP